MKLKSKENVATALCFYFEGRPSHLPLPPRLARAAFTALKGARRRRAGWQAQRRSSARRAAAAPTAPTAGRTCSELLRVSPSLSAPLHAANRSSAKSLSSPLRQLEILTERQRSALVMSGSYCKSLYPFGGEQHQQGLSFEAGEVIKVVQALPGGWWEGEKDGARGWFPSSYVQVLEVSSDFAVLDADLLKQTDPIRL